jgi:hypothetical protein
MGASCFERVATYGKLFDKLDDLGCGITYINRPGLTDMVNFILVVSEIIMCGIDGCR